MHQSILAAPIPPPGNCAAFARIVSPGGWALAYPRATPGLLTHTWFLTRNRAFHKLLEISKKVACNFSKSCSKVAQKSQKLLFVHVCNERFSKVTKEHFFCCCSLHLFGLMLKYANCTTKVIFLSKNCMSKYYASILIL